MEPATVEFSRKDYKQPIEEIPKMGEQLGTQNIKKAVNALGDLMKAVAAVAADGKVTITDIAQVPEFIGAGMSISSVYADAVEEIKDLSKDEITELAPFVLQAVFGSLEQFNA